MCGGVMHNLGCGCCSCCTFWRQPQMRTLSWLASTASTCLSGHPLRDGTMLSLQAGQFMAWQLQLRSHCYFARGHTRVHP